MLSHSLSMSLIGAEVSIQCCILLYVAFIMLMEFFALLSISRFMFFGSEWMCFQIYLITPPNLRKSIAIVLISLLPFGEGRGGRGILRKVAFRAHLIRSDRRAPDLSISSAENTDFMTRLEAVTRLELSSMDDLKSNIFSSESRRFLHVWGQGVGGKRDVNKVVVGFKDNFGFNAKGREEFEKSFGY